MSILASKLKISDTIGVVSPSGPVTEGIRPQFNKGIAKLQELGFKVRVGAHALSNTLGYSATPQEKAEDINAMFADKDVQAIFCSQGGQNANSVLPLLDYATIAKNPKIFFGISDISVLLNGIYTKTGLITFHGNDVMWGFGRNIDSYEIDALHSILMEGKLGAVRKNSKWQTLRGNGSVEGKLLGGNLSCLAKLIGTEFMPDFTDAVVFLEDYGAESTAEKTSYAFHHLDQVGVFSKIKGLLFGHYKTNNNIPLEFVAEEVIKKYNFPILKCNDFGHNTPNTIFPVGAHVNLNADNSGLSFIEEYLQQ